MASNKRSRRRLRRLIRAFKRMFPNAPPGLGHKILRSSFANGGAARHCTNRSDRFVVYATAVAWLRHHRTDYDRQIHAATKTDHARLRRAANRQARQLLEQWR